MNGITEFIPQMKRIEIKFLNKGEASMNTNLEVPINHPEAKPARATRRKKILLVDDDPAIRQILLRLLSEEGYFVVTAANETEAFEFASVMSFDLVLLDLGAPARDGWEIFEQLYAENPFLAIILITARPHQFDSALTPGVGALLEKPLDFTKLFFTIHRLLERPAETGALPASTHPHAALTCSLTPNA
jgi:DNA-binding response OmpR family regulator